MPTISAKNLPSREERREIGKKTRAFYEPLREKLERDHWGEYITIHPDNGDYAVSPVYWDAVKEMRAKYPSVLLYTIRIGYRAVGHRGCPRRVRWQENPNDRTVGRSFHLTI